jgi:hypothetical protein
MADSCYDQGPYGFGPFPDPSDPGSVVVCDPYPQGSGFGGLGFSLGAPYGMGSYGAIPQGAPPVPVSGGYGGYAYGHSSYGSIGTVAPEVTGAVSITGFIIEVFFSEEMDIHDPKLTDPASYTIKEIVGAPSTVVSVAIGQMGVNGATSVLVSHTGTTLSGTYVIRVTGPRSVGGIPILPTADIPEPPVQSNEALLLTRGEVPPFTITVLDGDELVLEFDYDMLPAAEEPVPNVDGILNPDSYAFTSSPDYPVPLTATAVEHPYTGDLSKVHLDVVGMTSLDYTSGISPATAIEYDGSILPSVATEFTGVEVGTGTSAIVNSKLSLSRASGNAYGWEFHDDTGRVAVDADLRVDFTFDASQATFTPPLSLLVTPTVGVLTVENGTVGIGGRVYVTLKRALDNSDRIELSTGAFSAEVAADWSSGVTTISVVHNRKAGLWGLIREDAPLLSILEATAELSTGTLIGASWVLSSGAFDVDNFFVHSMNLTATSTVFSGAWNFLHNSASSFTGSAENARDSFLTQRGPLVKGWGDATPATKQDVIVRVNDVEVGVAGVNPYHGEIFLEVPIPLMPPGDITVDADYKWFKTPMMAVAAYDTMGLLYDQWDHPLGHHDPAAHGEQIQSLPDFPKGAVATGGRFPMSTVYGPLVRPQPLQIGHRYVGFEKEYSALLDSPDTLLYDMSPHATSIGNMERRLTGVSVSYDGTEVPTSSDPPWDVQGDDEGQTNLDGTYTLIDANDGSYDPTDPQGVIYSRSADLSSPSSLFVVTRFIIEDYTVDGVFTGVGFGAHNDQRLFLVGALYINGVEHLGMLTDATHPHEVSSWDIGPAVPIEVESSTTFSAETDEVPISLKVGDRFQILEGSQAGVYTVAGIACDTTTGRTIVTVEEEFPEDPSLFGNRDATAYFEVLWSENFATYRLEADPDTGIAQVTVSGETSGTVVIVEDRYDLPLPAETSLLIPPTGEGGQVFWGSLSRMATNQTRWSFARYGIVPDSVLIRTKGIQVWSEMDVVPEDEPDFPWIMVQNFGFSEVDSSGESILLKSDSSHEALDFVFGYARTEPLFKPRINADVLVKFQLEAGVLGAGDLTVEVDDTSKFVRLATLLYYEFPGEVEYRRLITLPSRVASGILHPSDQGWTPLLGGPAVSVRQNYLDIHQENGDTYGFLAPLDISTILFPDEGGRIIEARLAVTAFTEGVDDYTGITFGADVGTTGMYYVGMSLRSGGTPGVRLHDGANTTIQAYNFDWTDGEQHTYRILADEVTDTVVLFIDDQIQLPTVALAPFVGGSTNQRVFFGVAGDDISGSQDTTKTNTVEWYATSSSMMPPTGAKRILGVYRRGDHDHINSWEIPRTDSSTAPNSAQVGPVVYDMDWRSPIQARIVLDREWGVTVFRPDLPPPPYYTPDDGSAGSGHITELLEPSAGWINVEMTDLPESSRLLGTIAFGALDGRSISQQRWDQVRYSLFAIAGDDFIAPEHMVYDWYNVVHSGELTKDITPEIVIVQSLDDTRLNLRPTDLFADYVYKAVDSEGTPQEQVYSPDEYTFDKVSQTLTLLPDSDGNPRTFTSSTATVTVVFKPGTPVTETYLLTQPLLDSVTLLNEGTPPIPKSQTDGVITTSTSGSNLDGIPTEPDDVIVDDPFKVLEFSADENALYESMSFYEIEDQGITGLISTICEGTLPSGFSGYEDGGEAIYSKTGTGPALPDAYGYSAGLFETGDTVGEPTGAHVLALSGTAYWDQYGGIDDGGHAQGGGMPGKFLMVGGGPAFLVPVPQGQGNIDPYTFYTGGTIGPGSAILWPNRLGVDPDVARGSAYDEGGVDLRTTWFLRIGGGDPPLEETFDWEGADDIPPTLPEFEPINPNGPPSATGHGSALFVVEDPVGAPLVWFIVEAAN